MSGGSGAGERGGNGVTPRHVAPPKARIIAEPTARPPRGSGRARDEPRRGAPRPMSPLVRQFRQILIWPLQLMPIREGEQIQEPWELLERDDGTHPWREFRDEFSCAPEDFQARHYSEFVTFLPYVRRFLYGEGPRPRRRARRGFADPRLPSQRHREGADDLSGPRPTPLDFDVAHVDLCFFYDLDIAILVVEIFANDLPLDARAGHDVPLRARVPDVLDRRRPRRPLPRAGASGSTPTGRCSRRRTTSSATSTSRSSARSAHRASPTHWTFLLRPLVPAPRRRDGPGALPADRVQPDAAARLPRDGRRARADPRRLHPAGPRHRIRGTSDALPYSARYVRDFEDRYCYDQYWNEEAAGRPGTRFMASGHAFVMVGDAVRPVLRRPRRRACSASSATSTSCCS